MSRLRIFISSPGDVPDERLRADLIVDKLAQEYVRYFALETYRWEHEALLASGHFQDAIEPPQTFDIVILIVWSRLGTPLPSKTSVREYKGIDGRVPVTGTEWEYEDALASARLHGTPDILAFRNVKPASVDARNPDARAKSIAQLDALDAFWCRHFADHDVLIAAFKEYYTLQEFADRLEEALRKLIERRIKALIDQPVADRGAVWLGAPFRGLEAYEFEHAPIYFGRDKLIAQAAEQFSIQARSGTAFLLVSGASGSGKSSLVKAGLVPRLMKPQRIEGTAFLRRAVFRPSDGRNDIILGFVEMLVRGPLKDGIGLPELLAPGQSATDLATHLRSAANGAGFVFSSALGRLTEHGRNTGRLLPYEQCKLILVIDQLEELFTADCITADDRQLFVQLINVLARSGLVWIVASMRADFWHRISELPTLMALTEGQSRLEVAPPSLSELTNMISKPAQAAGLDFETHFETGIRLDAVLAEHAATEPGVLPLLSFTLDALYEEDIVNKNGRLLTYATYEALGGLKGAIATRADKVIDDLPQAARNALSGVLWVLVTVSGATNQTIVARNAPMDSFKQGSDAQRVVDALIDARLLVATSDGAKRIVRLAHEALISHWQRAKDQLELDRRDLETRAIIEPQAVRWAAAPNNGLLLREPDLANALDLWKRRGAALTSDLQKYIARSTNYAKAAAHRRWAIASVVMICLAGLTVASIGALAIAEAQRDAALIAQSHALARDARAATEAGDPTLGMLLALSALPRDLNRPDRPLVIDAEYPLANAYSNRRERAVLHGHSGNINSVAFSSDGMRIVTGSEDQTALIWDAATGNRLETLSGHAGRVVAAEFSRDGGRVVTASADGTAGLWEAATGRQIAFLHNNGYPVDVALFSPNGMRIVTGSEDGDVAIWDGKNGALIRVLGTHDGAVLAAAFSADGKYIGSAAQDAMARIWETETGTQVAELKGHTGAINSIEFSPDGTRTVTASDDETARLWHLDGTPIAVLRGHGARVTSARFSGDDRLIATASDDNTVRLWDAATGQAKKGLFGHEGPVYSVGFSPDSHRIVTAADDHTARLWDAETRDLIAVLGEHKSLVRSAVFSPDGKAIVTASQEPIARLWNVEPAASFAVLKGHTEALRAIAYVPGGAEIATGSLDGKIRLWNATTGAAIRAIDGKAGPVNAIALAPDGTSLAAATGAKVQIFDPREGPRLAALQDHKGLVKSIAFSSDGTRVITASMDQSAKLWDAKTGALVGTVGGHRGSVNEAIFSPDGKLIATASSDKTAKLWDRNSLTLVADLNDHEAPVVKLAFSPDGTQLITGANDGGLRLWDGRTGTLKKRMEGHTNEITGIAFSNDGGRIVTASVDHTARLWDGKTGMALQTLRGHNNTVWSAEFSPDSERIVTASQDRTSRLWDVATGSQIAVFNGYEGAVRAALFSPSGRQIATASEDTTARLWTMPPLCQALINAAQSELPRDLTPTERAHYFLEKIQSDGLSRFYLVAGPLLSMLRPEASQHCE
jgi:WD40 repeat protein